MVAVIVSITTLVDNGAKKYRFCYYNFYLSNFSEKGFYIKNFLYFN